MGDLDTGWRNRDIGWKMDNIDLTRIVYADDICLLASSKDLELMVRECGDGFEAASLETGMNKNVLDKHNPLTKRLSEHRRALDPCSEKITSVGATIHLCTNSGSAMTNRLQKATGVCEKWSSTLCDTTLDLTKTNPLLQSVNAVQSGMAERLLDPCKKSGISSGFLVEHGSTRACSASGGVEEDIGSFWMRMHRMGHQCMKQHNTSLVNTVRTQKHRMAGHFARLDGTHLVEKKTLLSSPQLVASAAGKLGSERRQVERSASSTFFHAGDGSKISSSHTTGPCETRQNAPQM